jgi:hypothetical protein
MWGEDIFVRSLAFPLGGDLEEAGRNLLTARVAECNWSIDTLIALKVWHG